MKKSSAVSASTVLSEESYDIFLASVKRNLELEIEQKLPDRARSLNQKKIGLEQAKQDVEILKKKLGILNVDDNQLRKVLIENGKEKESLLEAEYKTLNEAYQQKLQSIKFKTEEDKKNWHKSDDGKKFILDQIKRIRSDLQQKFEEKPQQISSLESELQSSESALIIEGAKANSIIFEIPNIIDWLSNPENVEAKIANTEWYRKDTPAKEMNDLRKKFSEGFDSFLQELKSDTEKLKDFAKRNSISDEDLEDGFVDSFSIDSFKETEDGKKLIKSLAHQKIADLEQEKQQSIARKKEIITSLADSSSESYPIVWTIPGKVKKYGGDIDDFKYGSKKPEKEVFKPYTQIHRALMDANWALRDGADLTQNYITAHILFVVSDSPHQSGYQGKRTYIDFPINIAWDGQWDEKFLEDSDNNHGRGISKKASSFGHSEKALEVFLKDPENVANIVNILKSKLLEKFGSNEGFKIYEANLFLNSNKNVCNGCEQILSGIESSQSDESFLKLLKSELEKQGLKTLTKSNEQFPRMMISVSAYDYYSAYCSDRLAGDAQGPLQSQEYEDGLSGARIDTKQLSGKVILSSDELTLHPDFEYKKEFGSKETYASARKSRSGEVLSRDGVPFYSGFSSAGGSSDLLDHKRLKYQPPISFDEAPNLPKASTKARSGSTQLSSHKETQESDIEHI